ncbi:right-handed parallel beta-helix repeat-containing protein [bacterium]|nr:right-handed parallel beta-helix repeat-containing protein [bacterium]
MWSSLPAIFLPKRLLLVAALCLALSTMGYGRTITVERDGTGEFIILQEALNAAADGDTILIGPGEYTEMYKVKYPGLGWEVDVVGDIKVMGLTIIGAGPDQTLIGPAIQNIDYARSTPNCLVMLEGTNCRVEGVTLRNGFDGLYAGYAEVNVSNCRFVDNARSSTFYSVGGGGVVSSNFGTNFIGAQYHIGFLANGAGVTIDNCNFSSPETEFGVLVNGADDIFVQNCVFFGVGIGVQVSAGGSCRVANSNLDCEKYGVTVTPAATRCEIHDCEISGGWAAVAAANGILLASQSVFVGGIYTTLYFESSLATAISDCHIFKGTASNSVWCVQSLDAGQIQHDLRNNFWDTDDPSVIESLILDVNDDPNIHAEVLFEPFVGGPIGEEKTTWGDLKAMWR